ncbi:MAG TPA: hypothetical protein VGP68_06300 [Gemmataceae bacterium]|jgi:hypothetical protein|nr:hypothetical protein [Gemmataceae bacterium]
MSAETEKLPEVLVADRRGMERTDRRQTNDRRKKDVPVTAERRQTPERRNQGERRRQVDPTTCERDYSEEEIVFMKAMDQYKRANRRPFPTWSEVLEVLYALGYRKTADATALPGLAPPVPRPALPKD